MIANQWLMNILLITLGYKPSNRGREIYQVHRGLERRQIMALNSHRFLKNDRDTVGQLWERTIDRDTPFYTTSHHCSSIADEGLKDH